MGLIKALIGSCKSLLDLNYGNPALIMFSGSPCTFLSYKLLQSARLKALLNALARAFATSPFS